MWKRKVTAGERMLSPIYALEKKKERKKTKRKRGS